MYVNHKIRLKIVKKYHMKPLYENVFSDSKFTLNNSILKPSRSSIIKERKNSISKLPRSSFIKERTKSIIDLKLIAAIQ